MWINTGTKFKLFKKYENQLSARTVELIRAELNLIVFYTFIPLSLRQNEEYCFRLLNNYRGQSLSDLTEKIINIEELDDFDIPLFSKSLFYQYLYNVQYASELGSIKKIVQSIDISLINYRKPSPENGTLFDVLSYIKNKSTLLDEDREVQTKNNLQVLNNAEFTAKDDKYRLIILNKFSDIARWSIYLNNCLDSYLKGKEFKIWCNTSKEKHVLKMTDCMRLNLINLIAVYKNDKPFACIELVDSSDKIHQIFGKKNRRLEILDQHRILTQIDIFLGKELMWTQRINND